MNVGTLLLSLGWLTAGFVCIVGSLLGLSSSLTTTVFFFFFLFFFGEIFYLINFIIALTFYYLFSLTPTL